MSKKRNQSKPCEVISNQEKVAQTIDITEDEVSFAMETVNVLPDEETKKDPEALFYGRHSQEKHEREIGDEKLFTEFCDGTKKVQIDEGKRWAKETLGVELKEENIHYDAAVSGGTTGRTEYQKVLEKAYSGEFSNFIIFDSARIARSYAEFEEVSAKCARVHTAVNDLKAGGKDWTDEKNDLERKMTAFFADFRRTDDIKNARMHQRNRAKRGVVIGAAPYGFKIVKIPTDKGMDKIYIHDAIQAPVVKKIFELYTNDHETLGNIVKFLDKSGMDPKRAGKWTTPAVTHILENTCAMGVIIYGKNKSLKNVKLNKYDNVPQKKSNFLAIKVPRIVSKEVFEQAQLLRERQKKAIGKSLTSSGRPTSSVVSPLFYCAACKEVFGEDRHLNNRANGKKRAYQCSNKNCPTKKPGFKPVNWLHEDAAMQILQQGLKPLTTHDDAAREIRRYYNDYKGDLARKLEGTNGVKYRIQVLERRVEMYNNIIENDGIEQIPNVGKNLDKILAEKNDLEEQYKDLTEKKRIISGMLQLDIPKVRDFIDDLDVLMKTNKSAFIKWINMLVGHVYVKPIYDEKHYRCKIVGYAENNLADVFDFFANFVVNSQGVDLSPISPYHSVENPKVRGG